MADADRMSDYLEICAVKARYCRLLDTKDWAGYAELFTEDFVLDVSGSGGHTALRGRDEAIRMTRASIENARTAHQVHSPEIVIAGDEADAIWAMQDRVVWDAGRARQTGMASLTGYGHYHEHYVRLDGGWKIASVRLTRLHVDITPASAG